MSEKSKSIQWVSLALVVWVAISIGYSKWINPMIQPYTGELLGIFLKSIFVPYGIALPIAYLILRRIPPAPKTTGTKCSIRCAIELTIIQSGMSILPMFLLNLIFFSAGLIGQEMSTMHQEITRANIFLLLIFNPIAEEFLFRKLALDRLMECGAAVAIVVSAILFAIPHAFSQGIPPMVYTFVLGLVWAYAKIKTQSLLFPILLHSFSNLWGMLLPSMLLKIEIGSFIYLALWVILVPVAASFLLVKNRKSILLELKDT